MALTDEQKAANQRLRRIRDKAHALRCADFDARLNQILPPEQIAAAEKAYSDHCRYEDASKGAADAEAKELERQAADLVRRAQEIRQQQRDSRVRYSGPEVWKLKHDASEQCRNEFPDLRNCQYSPVAWNPPAGSDYIARATALVDARDAKKKR